MLTYKIQETQDGNCYSECWTDIDAVGWEDACARFTGVDGWLLSTDPFYELDSGCRLCRVQQFDGVGHWTQRWYILPRKHVTD